MKIKKIGWTSFLISSSEISAITDPLLLLESKVTFPKTSADIAIFTKYDGEEKENIIAESKLDGKVVPDHREKVFEIYSSGEYEIGGLMIRRDIGKDFYLIDENSIRVLYLGGTGNSFDPNDVKDVGDVDVMILPVGDGVNFMDFEKIEKVISNVDPAIILPCAYKEEGKADNLRSKEEFIKYFGFANVREEGYVNVTKKRVEEEQKSVDVIFL